MKKYLKYTVFALVAAFAGQLFGSDSSDNSNNSSRSNLSMQSAPDVYCDADGRKLPGATGRLPGVRSVGTVPGGSRFSSRGLPGHVIRGNSPNTEFRKAMSGFESVNTNHDPAEATPRSSGRSMAVSFGRGSVHSVAPVSTSDDGRRVHFEQDPLEIAKLHGAQAPRRVSVSGRAPVNSLIYAPRGGRSRGASPAISRGASTSRRGGVSRGASFRRDYNERGEGAISEGEIYDHWGNIIHNTDFHKNLGLSVSSGVAGNDNEDQDGPLGQLPGNANATPSASVRGLHTDRSALNSANSANIVALAQAALQAITYNVADNPDLMGSSTPVRTIDHRPSHTPISGRRPLNVRSAVVAHAVAVPTAPTTVVNITVNQPPKCTCIIL